jgi:alkyl sulfatase BDS1-like metallo-beta-lactamase superfamily hydrolase
VQSTPTPDETFEDTFTFELGGTRFELLSTPGGETVDSAVLWLPQRRIAFVGNLFSALFGHFPNLVTIRGDRLRSALAFMESADRVLELQPEILCTGHFEPIVGADLIRAEITRVRDAVRYVHDAVVAGMNAGTDVETLMSEIRLPDDLEVGEGYGKVSWSVRAIWEGYAGWFHARSTTELYPVPVSDAYPTVVGLTGADPLAAAAHAAVAEGRPERAVHLAEMVLAAEPDHRGALVAYRDAHEALLARDGGENFWETGWLRHRIAATTEKLEGQP